MKIYLASPFFKDIEIKVYNKVIEILRNQGHNVYVPKEHTIPNAWSMPNDEWASLVFKTDKDELDKSDCVVVLNWGLYSDSGTAWECGYAYAIGKKIVNICCNPISDYSLMVINGANICISLNDLQKDYFVNVIKESYPKTFNIVQK